MTHKRYIVQDIDDARDDWTEIDCTNDLDDACDMLHQYRYVAGLSDLENYYIRIFDSIHEAPLDY